MDGSLDRPLTEVIAPLTYLDPAGGRPVAYMYEPPPGVLQRSGRYVAALAAIRNGRPEAARHSLDAEGFRLLRHASATADFYDAEAVRRDYYPEAARLVREATGAAEVLVFDHNVRNGPLAARGEAGAREPVRRVHNDYTHKSGPQRVRDLLPAAEAERRLARRFAIVNVWRPIRGPVLDTPLAVCDARSIAPEDFLPTDLVYRDRVGETYGVAASPQHRWWYFPRMQPDEALLLKCYDSATDGRARFTAHTAFDDPTAPADAPARESIEARTIAFFAD